MKRIYIIILATALGALSPAVRASAQDLQSGPENSQTQDAATESEAGDDYTAARSARSAAFLRIADSLRMNYDFRASVDYYRQAVEAEPDSTRLPFLEDKKLLGENGANMMDYVYEPTVVARHRFSTKDFFLYYPLQDKTWRKVPNVLDSLSGHPFAAALYAPDDADEIFFSAQDENGVRNIYRTEYNDSTWDAPELLDEGLVSDSDEIYPMLSEDGQTIYFSSRGLFGIGGYDIYYSTWNRRSKSWSTPVNLGFPYSSPYDDMLFCNSPDGKYTVFASNRACPADSIDVYVLEHDSMPIHMKVETAEELREIMKLEPQSQVSAPGKDAGATSSVPESEDTKLYMSKIAEVKSLRDSIYLCGVAMDEARNKYAMSDDVAERARLSQDITDYELTIPQLQSRLDKAVGELQTIEMDFLYKGVVIDPDKVRAEADVEIVTKDIDYTFSKMHWGAPLDIEVEASDKFDYSFMILPEGQFAPDNTLPSGLVYQIQIFSISRKATVKDLHGLSPVFERGHYVYSVGLFRTYNDVLSQLNKVRRAGFKTAFIVAFLDGKSISVTSARAME
ncbi:MAG: hypothetical protein LUC24_06970 [Bacteroidales bacterium]|nr:hypothetical protein [Bacteroidales bacterium]